MAAKHEIDMSRGSILKNLIRFAIPVMLASILQLLYNAADLVVVSNFASGDAMASVGATSSLYNLLTNVFIGISLGTSVIVAKRYGAMDTAGLFKAVHTSMAFSGVVGIVAMAIGLLFAKPLLVLMDTPAGPVLDGASLYMTIIFIGVPASVVYNFGAAVLRSVGDTKRPLYILTISGAVNVILNLIFVIGFKMSVDGVAWATVISNYFSMFMIIYALRGADGAYRLHFKELRFYKNELLEILKIGVPSGVQSSVFSLSNSVIQSAINSFGGAAIKGGAAAASIEGFVYTSMNSFYQATLTCVGQNYGAKNEKRIKKTLFISLACVTVVGFGLGMLTVIFKNPLLSIYIKNDAEAIAFGAARVTVVGMTYFLCGMMECFTGVLRGFGYSTITAINSLVGTCGFRILWVAFALPLNRTMYMLFYCWPLSWILIILMHLVTYLIVRKRAFRRMYEQ